MELIFAFLSEETWPATPFELLIHLKALLFNVFSLFFSRTITVLTLGLEGVGISLVELAKYRRFPTTFLYCKALHRSNDRLLVHSSHLVNMILPLVNIFNNSDCCQFIICTCSVRLNYLG